MDNETAYDNDHEEEIAAMMAVENMAAETHFMLQLILTVVNFTIERFFNSRRKKAVKYNMHAKIPSQVDNLARLFANNDAVCINKLRMNMRTFRILCEMIRNGGGVAHSKYVSLEEKVASFLFVLAHHTKNRVLQYMMQRSGETISHYFHEILGAVLLLHDEFLVRPEPVPPNFGDSRWNIFEGCLGALDGTYIKVRVGDEDKVRYRSRKGEIAINVLGVCDRNMNFIFIMPGWEGSAADGRILRDAVTRVNGLKVPTGLYYLADAGYTNGPGFLVPYKGQRYHLATFRGAVNQPQNHEEYFNMKHAQARNVIERCFGLMKMRWGILREPSHYSVKTHGKIVMACAYIHNLIRREMPIDPMEAEFDEWEQQNVEQNVEQDEEIEYVDSIETTNEWTTWREELAHRIYNEWRGVI